MQYSNNIDFKVDDLIKAMRCDLIGKTFSSINGRLEHIDDITRPDVINGALDVILKTSEDTGASRTYGLIAAINSPFCKFSPDTMAIINNYLADINAINAGIKAMEEHKLEEHKAVLAARDKAIKDAERARLMEERANNRRKSVLKYAENLSNMQFDAYTDFFVELGYIAKHSKRIEARMPDYLDKWFMSEFGDAEHYVVDSSKKTPSGLPPQFTLSIKIELDTNDNIPATLNDKLSTSNKPVRPVADTAYAFNLCKNFGFKFGKKQDIDEILSCIPSNMMDSFNLGYSL